MLPRPLTLTSCSHPVSCNHMMHRHTTCVLNDPSRRSCYPLQYLLSNCMFHMGSTRDCPICSHEQRWYDNHVTAAGATGLLTAAGTTAVRLCGWTHPTVPPCRQHCSLFVHSVKSRHGSSCLQDTQGRTATTCDALRTTSDSCNTTRNDNAWDARGRR